MKKYKLLNIVTHNFHIYKGSFTIFLWSLSTILSILGNIFGPLYLVIAILPVFALGILLINDRKNTDL